MLVAAGRDPVRAVSTKLQFMDSSNFISRGSVSSDLFLSLQVSFLFSRLPAFPGSSGLWQV